MAIEGDSVVTLFGGAGKTFQNQRTKSLGNNLFTFWQIKNNFVNRLSARVHADKIRQRTVNPMSAVRDF